MFDPADRRKQILYKAVAALARRERSRLGLYKKLSETFNEEGDKELINSSIKNTCLMSGTLVFRF